MHNIKYYCKIPRVIATFYVVLALITVPWTVYLDQTLPVRHTFHNWDIAWVGLDIFLCFMLLMTGLLLYKQSKWVIFPSIGAATCLIIDVWFDVLGSHSGHQLIEAVILAILVELPLALVSTYIAYKVIKNIN